MTSASNSSWLQSLPAGWGECHLRWLAKLYAGGTPSKDKPEYWTDGTIPWLNSGTVNQELITEPSAYISKEGYENSSAKWVPQGALVMALAGQGKTKGMVAQMGIDATCNQSMAAIVPKSINARFLFYWLTANYRRIRSGASDDLRDGLNLQMLGDIPCPVPRETAEQERIANFLDEKTVRIDALIEEKEQLLERISEYRRSLVSSAVTEGVPGRHSEFIPHHFLGRVPNTWRVGRFRQYVQVRSGQVDPENSEYSDMVLIAPNHIESGTGRLLYTETAAEQAAESGKYWCDAGDVIYSKIRPALRKTTIAPFDCLCSADMYPLKGIGPLSNEYLFWYLLSEPFSDFAVQESMRVAMPKLNRETLADAAIPLPSADEQSEIVEYIKRSTEAVDSVAEHASQHIDRLREYRSSLISAAVTGQLDIGAVKEAA